MDVTVGHGFVVMECRGTFHTIVALEMIRERLQHRIRIKAHELFRQCDDQLSRFHALAISSAALELDLVLLRQVFPNWVGICFVGRVQVLLSCRV